jgi:hypothetical protein
MAVARASSEYSGGSDIAPGGVGMVSFAACLNGQAIENQQLQRERENAVGSQNALSY